MNNKNYIGGSIIILILAVAGSFYGGMQYGTNNAKAQLAQGRNGGAFGGGANGGARGGQVGGQRGAANGGAGDIAAGQIVAKDDTSITVKTRDGGSKIVFFSASTAIDKAVSGAASDLSEGQQIMASGKTSPDGSLTAQTIQIRPAQQK